MKLIFAGTPDFAATCLSAILRSQHQILAVYTQPDRKAGRGRQLKPSAVKMKALENNLSVEQPESLKDIEVQSRLAAYHADVIVVVAYGLLLPSVVLSTPKRGCLNIHASLLPKWRGAAPIQRSIQAGDTSTGITIMQMEEGLDTGPMLMRREIAIAPEDNATTIHDKLAVLGGELIVTALDQLEHGSLPASPQDHAIATYAKKISKREACIDWRADAGTILNTIRAFHGWPVAYTLMNGKTIRIWDAQLIETDAQDLKDIAGDDSNDEANVTCGRIISATKLGLDVQCGNGRVRLLSIQLPGAKPLPIADLLNSQSELFSSGKRFESPPS